MTEQNFGEHFNYSGILDGTGPDDFNPKGYKNPDSANVPESEALLAAEIEGRVVAADPMDETVLSKTPEGETASLFPAPLLDPDASDYLRTRWNEIQAKFVDEPRSSVQQADALVLEVVAKITQMFTDEQHSLEGQWNQGNDVSTEDLRKVLQHYRSFFNRLVV